MSRSSAENSSDVISLVSAAGRVLYASASSLDVFGYLPQEIVGLNAFDLIHPDDRVHFRRAFDTVLATPPGPRQVKVRVCRKNGECPWVESTFSNLLDEPRIGAIVVNCREISAERGTSAEEQTHTDDLNRSNARLEDFAYAVAHDLREPLRTISMFTDILIQEAEMDAHGAMMAQFIMNGVTRMSALFEGLHAFAVRGFDDPAQPLDLSIVAAEVLGRVDARVGFDFLFYDRSRGRAGRWFRDSRRNVGPERRGLVRAGVFRIERDRAIGRLSGVGQ